MMEKKRPDGDLLEALQLLYDADNYLTDGDPLDHIAEEGSPDVAEWAGRVRRLLDSYAISGSSSPEVSSNPNL